MDRLLSACAVLVLAVPSFAEEKPRSLPPKEAAAGRLMLFDGVTTFGWRIEGEAAVKDGWLILGGTKATTATSTAQLPVSQIWIETDYICRPA